MIAKTSTRKAADTKPVFLKKTLEIISGKWRLHIIYQIGNEVRRYGELRRMIPQVSEKVLVQELKALVSLGVLEKKSSTKVPTGVDYALTANGRHILPTLLKLTSVGEIFLKAEVEH